MACRLGARVFRPEDQRLFQAIGPAADRAPARRSSTRRRSAGGAGRVRGQSSPEGAFGRARVVVVAVGGHVEVGPRRLAQGRGGRERHDRPRGKKSHQGHGDSSLQTMISRLRLRWPASAAYFNLWGKVGGDVPRDGGRGSSAGSTREPLCKPTDRLPRGILEKKGIFRHATYRRLARLNRGERELRCFRRNSLEIGPAARLCFRLRQKKALCIHLAKGLHAQCFESRGVVGI